MRTLGLDLGTNSIGWAIREDDEDKRKEYIEMFKKSSLDLNNQIVDYGVIVFKKGVGDGKKGEFSLAADRRTYRSKRRLYNAKRYRKWELLKLLIEYRMCPLTIDELKLWSIGDWKKGEKNKGRIYPSSPDFKRWLAMDFDKIGTEYKEDEKLKPEFSNPYLLRCFLLESNAEDSQKRRYQIGRALYHLAQRRGFKTSRKGGKTSFGEEVSKRIEKFYEKYPEKKHWKISQIFSWMQSEKCTDIELKLIRIRKEPGVIQRKYYEEEFLEICKKQNLKETFSKCINQIVPGGDLFDAVYFVRPLKSQKGLVGKCTLEKNKPRIPISHPLFEEFRALQFINNIQWRETGSNKQFEPIPLELKKRIFEKLFFRPSKPNFKFEEIVKNFSENFRYEFNYAKYKDEKPELNNNKKFDDILKSNPSVSACPVIADLMNVFEDEWKNKFIQDENKFGIDWEGLVLKYKLKYVTKKKDGKGLKKKKKGKFIPKNIGEERILDYEGIWHLLFDYLLIKDNKEGLEKFCKVVLNWDEDKAKRFCEINIQQGYGSLSRNAISKILPYLQEGYIYSEAVYFANLEKALGKEKFLSHKEAIKQTISNTIKNIDKEKEKLNIVNGLIQKYFGENEFHKAKGLDDTIKEVAKRDVEEKLKMHFGENNWNKISEDEKKEYFDYVLEKYLKFLDGKQLKEEKASSRQGKNPEIDYYLVPRLDEAIKKTLKQKFGATEKNLKYLYHPSDIDIYPKSKKTIDVVDKITGEIKKIPQLESPEPPSKGWKNPMAMRTMYELKKLVNYLLKVGKIDVETKIVIEMARELNDSNLRKAIEYWQNDKEKENKEFAAAIAEMYGVKNPSYDDYNKFKAAVEQLTQVQFCDEKAEKFKKKYEEFVATYLIGKKGNINTQTKEENEEAIEEIETNPDENPTYDYLMYLILNRDEFIKLLNYKIPNSKKTIPQIIKTTKDFKEKRNELNKMLTKYRLWKEQNFQCLYTGQIIPFTELFSDKYQIEHTIPRSISFDSELKNLSVCDASYNNFVKNKSFPTECPNYYQSARCATVKGEIECTPIKERVERLIKPKVEELKKRIKNLEAISKKIQDWEIDKKNANIQLRHYLQFELEYWEKKYFTFTVERKDWKEHWKNSQLVDTQIITKYARAYMKTVFERVDVQKAIVVNEFKKIYEIKGDEQKDRSRHSHHAMDAAVLTLIPGSAQREEILKKYYSALEQKEKFHDKPYRDFDITHILRIDENILINHISRDKTLVPTKKKLRKRGKIEYKKVETLPERFKNKIEGKDYFKIFDNGKEKFKIPIYIEGDSIRGQLHKETFFGVIKPPLRNNEGYQIKENGKFLVQKNEKGDDDFWIVARKKIEEINLEKDKIVDELLKKHIQKQIEKGIPITNVTDFNNKKIRHLRCVFKAGKGFLNAEKAIILKKHSHPSNHQHKIFYRTSNEENYLCLYYEGFDKKKKPIYAFRFINLFEFSKLRNKNIFNIPEYASYTKNKNLLNLKSIIKSGDIVILYQNSRDEIEISNPNPCHFFRVYKFNNSGADYIYLQNVIEARPDKELGHGETKFIPNKFQPRLKLTAENFKFAIKGKDFEIMPDGEIIWKF
jgi:CRISPR-associated endonuclease Csn1